MRDGRCAGAQGWMTMQGGGTGQPRGNKHATARAKPQAQLLDYYIQFRHGR